MSKFLEATFGRTTAIKNGVCIPDPIGCGGPATEFKDALSRIEYSISGLCQKCQDIVFDESADENTDVHFRDRKPW